MSLAPKCPKCGANGHDDGAKFDMYQGTVDLAAKHDLDPERTSADWFRCLTCDHEFPGVTWTRETVKTPSYGLFFENGQPYEYR